MPDRSVIVVVLDRWGAGQAAPIGATMLDMPGTNRLAASSLTANFCLSDSADLDRVYRSYWSGFHAADPRVLEPTQTWLMLLQEASSLLVSDEPIVQQHDFARHFEARIAPPPSESASSAEDVADTHLAKLLFAAGEAILESDQPGLTWIHARALAGPWDAPLELRRSLADEDDPEVPDFVFPPQQIIRGQKNYDEILGVTQACGGQILALDELLASFLNVLDQRPAEVVENTLVVVTSPRGFPLGEHGVIGAASNRLYSELLQVPLFVRFGRGDFGSAGALQRTSALIQPPDIGATIADWLGLALPAEAWGRSLIPLATRPDPTSLAPTAWRDALSVAACASDASPASDAASEASPLLAEAYLATPSWAMRSAEGKVPGERSTELFAKPDDRWEVNEIGSRAVLAREAMETRLEELAGAIRKGDRAALSPLPDLLMQPIR